ncbi:MAG TPA: hypothetical protein VNJ51_10475 [Candidatus Dormibacteraeota bacterium]|nr:hypothetical protein [Candidatus Dormibacteraeota bacterium]
MIAARLLPEREPERRERPRPRPHRGVAQRRATWLRIVAVASLPFILVMAYVALFAHVTTLGYAYARAQGELAKAQAEHTQLQDETARLESPQRLAAIAKRLGMRDPGTELVVRLGAPPAVASRGPLASGVALISEAASSILRMR